MKSAEGKIRVFRGRVHHGKIGELIVSTGIFLGLLVESTLDNSESKAQQEKFKLSSSLSYEEERKKIRKCFYYIFENMYELT